MHLNSISFQQTQWLSLLILIIGVAMVQLSDAKESNVATSAHQNKFFGFCVALFACVLSGLAGIYFEKILKGKQPDHYFYLISRILTHENILSFLQFIALTIRNVSDNDSLVVHKSQFKRSIGHAS